MSVFTFINGRIVTADGIVETGHVIIDNGIIASVSSAPATPQGEIIDLDGGYLLPGFIDTQVNGGGGVLFNDTPTKAAIAAIGEAHAAYGTTGFMTTLISDRLDVVDAALNATKEAIDAGIPGVLGVHLEGPFLNAERKGIHNAEVFRTLDAASKALLSRPTGAKTMVTLAPEKCTPDDIRDLVAKGVIVAAGHTNATYGETLEALSAGVSGFTHLFNAMSPFSHRAPGVAGAALEDQKAYCGIILDGQHVHPAAARIAFAARPVERFMLVTDAMPTVGMAHKTFTLNGKTIRVENGVCIDDNGTLAGSDLDMASAFRYAVTVVGVSVRDAAFMAATAPAAFVGVSDITGEIRHGLRADLVWMDADLNLRGVWLAGQRHGGRAANLTAA
ncbi:N-acetylglucosamine-6-phosphate deacetylase [Asticcacaulis sp. ZE23SCel15]|uniref:N-acetylglucosamine-6-phosphate deacetylase n=1 Tax=Asticcacaulis sp. ZE23SCel15 TaxID=3059027 RepID=UPI00265EF22D|nr:N-acetylglucosamine-6-phosphate deacetylase [Asticcacaulis sp. ZE23SCel15]WKL56079.1 N-acetylglucosamine-6-phosphate deacetylase [Asticcacaulis sp. ZE23SCel15]